jgi:tetratricopeptide (TPR) repeat protein
MTYDVVEAEQPYHEILRRDPGRADAWNSLGLLAMQSDRLEAAVERLEKAVALEASNAVYHNHLGVAAAGMKQTDRAIECFQKAVEIDPRQADAHYNWGNVLRGLKRLDEAASRYRAALAITPNSPKMRYNLANTLRDLGNLNEAAAEYREAIRIRPNYIRAYTNLGNLYREQGRLEDAAPCTARRSASALTMHAGISTWGSFWPNASGSPRPRFSTAPHWPASPISQRPAAPWQGCWASKANWMRRSRF